MENNKQIGHFIGLWQSFSLDFVSSVVHSVVNTIILSSFFLSFKCACEFLVSCKFVFQLTAQNFSAKGQCHYFYFNKILCVGLRSSNTGGLSRLIISLKDSTVFFLEQFKFSTGSSSTYTVVIYYQFYELGDHTCSYRTRRENQKLLNCRLKKYNCLVRKNVGFKKVDTILKILNNYKIQSQHLRIGVILN